MTKIFGELRGLSRMRPLQFLVIVAIMGLVAWHSCVLKFCVTDPDIWWHLRVGDWIIANRTVPHVGIFSRTAANMPWVAYSWDYEVLLSLAYRWSGIFGIGVFGVVLTVVVAYAIMSMLRRLSGSFWIACCLSAATYFSMLFTMMPRPHFFSIVLFVLVITILLDAQRNASVVSLRWLPFIFLVWANLHIQFIYGLFLFGLFVAVNLAQRAAVVLGAYSHYVQPPTMPAKLLVVLFAISVLATLVGPNTYHVYKVIFEYSRANFGYLYIRELQALDFRFPEHFGQLLLTGAAFLVVGWQKKIDPFKLGHSQFAHLSAFAQHAMGGLSAFPQRPASQIFSMISRANRTGWRVWQKAARCSPSSRFSSRLSSRTSDLHHEPWIQQCAASSRSTLSTTFASTLFPDLSITHLTGVAFSSGICRNTRSPSMAATICMEMRWICVSLASRMAWLLIRMTPSSRSPS